MHYVGEGEPLVLLHGDPTWGYLYRRFIPPLSTRARCLVPDHMAMGKSGVPSVQYPYRLRHHIDNLEKFILGLELHDITLAVHGWGGPVRLGFAIRHPRRLKRLILMNTWAFAPWPGGPLPRLIELIRSPRGEAFIMGRNSYVKPALTATTARAENLTETVLGAYLAPFPTPESRRALLSWSRDIPVTESDASYADMQHIENRLAQFKHLPVLLAWGMQDPVLPPAVLRRWQQLYSHATTLELDEASHFLQEDAPERIVQANEEFLEAYP